MTRFRALSRSRPLWPLAIALSLAAGPAHAAGVTVQSFADMASFPPSPFYVDVTTLLAGGPSGNCATGVEQVAQGDAAVPSGSAGGPLNALVTPEIVSAAAGVPTVFSGATDTALYAKQYVSVGNETSGGANPTLELDIPPVNLAGATFLGYEIAIVDLGENLAPGSGSRNSERTTFRGESSAGGGPVQVGQI